MPEMLKCLISISNYPVFFTRGVTAQSKYLSVSYSKIFLEVVFMQMAFCLKESGIFTPPNGCLSPQVCWDRTWLPSPCSSGCQLSARSGFLAMGLRVCARPYLGKPL